MRGAIVYHCETPVAESRSSPSIPLSPGGAAETRGEPSADGASSVSRLSAAKSKRRGGSGR
ncbi:hypothetical protein EYF80_036819 [Liparis tanakae]|uniref:Uncharacterized protein n=1 Tax=Liparis tanakae TaxID=230148 RepID=A0A4Z2GJH4_9TELE|nr:hypothetical protein EYF80_036819 [Liparis tanakae]